MRALVATSTVAAAVAVAFGTLCAPGTARAWAPIVPSPAESDAVGVTGAPPAQQPPAQQPPAQPTVAPTRAPEAADVPGPPPAGYYPPFAGYPPNPYGFDPRTMLLYDQDKKEPAVAVVLEFVVPGLGSIYAGHPLGAFVTWGLTIGGVAVMISGIGDGTTNGRQTNGGLLLLGLGMVAAGRIYGIVDSYSAAKDHNRALAARLGLPPGFALGVAPVRLPERTAWGPSLSFRF
jgi:hypothetical protein